MRTHEDLLLRLGRNVWLNSLENTTLSWDGKTGSGHCPLPAFPPTSRPSDPINRSFWQGRVVSKQTAAHCLRSRIFVSGAAFVSAASLQHLCTHAWSRREAARPLQQPPRLQGCVPGIAAPSRLLPAFLCPPASERVAPRRCEGDQGAPLYS